MAEEMRNQSMGHAQVPQPEFLHDIQKEIPEKTSETRTGREVRRRHS